MFISFVIGVIVAVLSFYQLAVLPSIWVGVLLIVMLILTLLAVAAFQSVTYPALDAFKSRTLSPSIRRVQGLILNATLGFIIGMTWVFWQTFFTVFIDESWLNKPVQLHGTVVGLVHEQDLNQRVKLSFTFKIDKIQRVNEDSLHGADLKAHTESVKNDQAWSFSKPNIKLSWYLSQSQYQQLNQRPASGQQWQLFAKLKANHAAMNLGALDYEAWLFQNGIAARGYILDKPQKGYQSILTADSRGFELRSQLSQKLQQVFEPFELSAIYRALTFGDRTHISDSQWQVLQNTGTIHLMAISGLHMGIVAGLGYLFFKALWWLGAYRLQRFTLPLFAAIGAGLFATFYLMLSGYAIPTQRAYLMVLAVLVFIGIRRSFQPWSALALAALLVVLWDTRSLLSIGFWLSFLAVALIFATLKLSWVKQAPRWQQLVWIQLALTVGLAPFLVWAFHSLPSYSLLSNLFAVPFVSLIGLPLLFVTSLLSLLSTNLAMWVMSGVDTIWSGFWSALLWVSQFDRSQWVVGSIELWQLTLIYIGIFVFLLHPSRQLKAVSALLVLLLMTSVVLSKPRPENGQAWLHLLDVGQGQAVVVETSNHVLVYDTGAKWGTKMDGAKLAILPFLRAQNWQQVDKLMVSHSDIDHAGGFARLLERMQIKQISSGQPQALQNPLSTSTVVISQCQAGQSWSWDGVEFEVLSPVLPAMDLKVMSDNDHSCVLKVTAGRHAVLIPGDLSSRLEAQLIELYADKLQANVLVAGHHGSRSSTSTAWLEIVKPEVVLFTTGYKNRYGFPNRQTLARLPPSVNWFNTACSGGVGYLLGGEEGAEEFDALPLYQARKLQQKWYHHSCLAEDRGVAFQ